jgi:RNA polymerase sigma-70 factor (ECF subfamily)
MLYSSANFLMDADPDHAALMDALRARDEAAFTHLVEKYHASMVRVAGIFVHDAAIAEELAQETWLAVLNGLDGFEGRSSLKTWIFSILTNKARTRGRRESRMLFYADAAEAVPGEPSVDPDRFSASPERPGAGYWLADAAPASWAGIPEQTLLAHETLRLIRQAIHELPELQRLVITLHDIDQVPAQEICNVLKITDTNQRVLLHRARAKVRQALEDYLQVEQDGSGIDL